MPAEYALRLLRVIDETPDTKTFVLDRGPSSLDFAPGQFVNVITDVPEHGRVRRAYSIASSPLDVFLELTVKKFEDGILSKFLCDRMTAGDLFHVKGPYGVFTLTDRLPRLLFVAGGSGIVPFRSMWRYLLQQKLGRPVTLVYAARSPEYVIYRDEILSLPSNQFNAVHVYSRYGEARRLDKTLLRSATGDLSDTLCYVCGPPAMCGEVASWLKDFGVNPRDLKLEKYD